MKIYLLSLISLFFFLGCAAPLVKTEEISHSRTMKVSDIKGGGVLQKPVVADLEVKGQKVRGESYISLPASLKAAQLNALANALEKSNADVLIEPIYKTQKTNAGIKASVTGFPGYYRNFRSVTIEDLPLLNVEVENKTPILLSKATEIKEEEIPRSNLKTILIVAGVVSGIALLLFLFN